ncbi:MAG: hypothetical protein IKF14_11320 [Atopobiaceae bacterium]|nr:hypothetical protein [Atopobiaceae bacterium]
MATKRPTTFSMRMPEDLNEKINAYATEHSCTKAEAMSHFARAGIALEEGGIQPNAAEAKDDGSREALQKIEARLEALQKLPTIEPAQQTSLVPVDIRERIQAYSAENACSEQDALTYYARLGIQLSGETRQATNADVAELRTRLDALAQDSQKKSEQLAQMADALVVIREYTKPEELELEGEVADDAEDVDQPELTEEERQRIADEHTRQIVSSVMEEYLGQEDAQAGDAQLDSRPQLNQWIPVLVAIIVSLVIGLVVALIR